MQNPSERIETEAPYTKDYNEGYIFYRKNTPRKYIQLVNTENRRVAYMSYGRYVFQVDYWKKTGRLIPDDYEVDHRDDDCTNDHIDNLQLMTRVDNIRKRDIAAYKNKIVTPEVLQQLGQYLTDGYTYQLIREKLELSQGHFRHLVSTYYPDYTMANQTIFQINKDDVRSYLEKDISQHFIADLYGVSQITISRYIADYLPEYSHEKILTRKLEYIRNGLAKGMTTTEIGAGLKCTPSNISYYTSKYFPEYKERLKDERQKETLVLVDKIKDLCEKNITQKDMAKYLDVPVGRICDIIGEYLPQYTDKNAYEIRVRRVGELLKENKSNREIADILNIRRGVVVDIISRCYPEHGRNNTVADKLVKLKTILESGESLTVEEIAERIGVAFATASNYINTYFPEHSYTSKYTQLNPEIRRLAEEDKLSHHHISKRLGVAINYVRKVLDKQSRFDKTSPYLELIPQIKDLLEKRYTYGAIATTLDLPLSIVSKMVSRHLPEYHKSRQRYNVDAIRQAA